MPTIDQLAEAVAVGADDKLPIMQGGATKGARASKIKSALALTKDDVGLGNVPNLAAGVANGLATLGADGKLTAAQLPAAVGGGLVYDGVWNASTNTPAIPTAAPTNAGHYYKVAVAGTTNINGNAVWAPGDWIISNGSTWDRIVNAESVSSVAGKTGAISLTKSDVGLSAVDNTSDAAKPVSTAQAAAIAVKKDILQAEASLSAASTVNLPGVASERVLITGAATINSLGTGTQGLFKEARFSAGGSIIKHNVATGVTALTSADITVEAGDLAGFYWPAAGTACVMVRYTRASGKALVGSALSGGLVSSALIAAPTAQMLADQTAIYIRNVSPFDRWYSDGFRLHKFQDSLDDSAAYNPNTGRLEVSNGLLLYSYPSQASGVLSSTPKDFEGLIITAQSGTNTFTVWDSSTSTTTGKVKLLEITTPALNTWYGLPKPAKAIEGLYFEVAGGGNKTMNFKRSA